MKKKLFLLLATLLLTAYAVRPGLALCGFQPCGCHCQWPLETQDYEGSGATCSEASASAWSQSYAEASGGCPSPGYDGICSPINYVVDIPCYWDDAAQVYKEVGHASFRCRVCE